MRHDQIALQLYTLRVLAAEDLAGTLRSVSAAGYRAVELAGLPETAPAELKRMLDDNGLQPIASHEGIERLRADAGAVAGRLVELGCPRVIVPWMPEADRATAAAVRAFASELAAYARRMAEEGIKLGYHNHDFEFGAMEGSTIWEIFLGALPSVVELELDVYWASVGGRDPVAEIGAIADRVRLLHMKDRAAGPTPRDAPVGEGTLAMPAIVEAADAAGVEWFIVEQDEPAEPLANIATSLRYLETLAD
jgi:sugar phosphate isomerase/epimerase